MKSRKRVGVVVAVLALAILLLLGIRWWLHDEPSRITTSHSIPTGMATHNRLDRQLPRQDVERLEEALSSSSPFEQATAYVPGVSDIYKSKVKSSQRSASFTLGNFKAETPNRGSSMITATGTTRSWRAVLVKIDKQWFILGLKGRS